MDLSYKKHRKLNKPSGRNDIKSVGLKLLSVALVAGCSLISGQSVAAETDVFTPTLDRLHNGSVKIPGSDEIYPESEYTVTEIFPSDTNNLAPNVIKYYDPNTTGDSTHYYEVNLKNSVYGEGSSQKYYKWEKDSNGVKLTETTDSSEAVLTIKFNPGDSFTQVHTPEGATLSVVNEIYVGGNIKKLIANKGTVNSISSKFIENTIEVNSSDTYDYSAVMSEYGANIKNINSSFIGNEVNIDASGKTIYGPLVKSLSKIGNVNSEFIANRVTSNTNLNGGLIEAAASANIDNITSDFLLNSSIVNGANLDGGVISNEGTIGGINSSVFVGNYGITDSGNINGAVINNSGTITDGINSSVFNGNYGKTSSGTAKGGAIYNAYQMSVTNSIFTGNYVESETGQAYGGAIYTDSNLTINATDGKTTEFTDNYVIKNGVRDNQAIYVDSATATLTLSAVNNGKILLNDNINGANGYRVDLVTDETGTIYLYNNINNAGVSATNANINMADGNYFDYDFLSLNAGSGGKFTIDANFASGKADTFTLGNNSNGTIYINDINLIGNIPTVEKTIQLLTGPDTISVELSQNLIDKYHKVTQAAARYEVDNINTNSKWSDIYNGHVYQDTITEGIRTAITDTNRTTADSIEYYITTETTESVKQIGATFALMNREVSGTRSFSANSAQDVYTVKEDLGKTASGTLNVVGARDGDTLATIDVNGRTMMELVNDNTRVNFSNINIINPKNETGAVLKITNPTASVQFAGNTTISTGSETAFDGIVNNGTLTINNERNNNTFTSDTGITGTGYMNLFSGTMILTNGASINQDRIGIGGILDLSDGGSITGDISITTGSKLIANASNLHDTDHSIAINYDSRLVLTGGTLNDNITTGGSRAYLDINGDVTNNAEIYAVVTGTQPESSFTTSATLLKANVESMENLVITDGEQNYDLKGKNITITGDVVNNNGVINAANQFYLAEGATLTTTIDKIGVMRNSKIVDGILNVVGGSNNDQYHPITGNGTINILKDSTTYSGWSVKNLYIKDGATLSARADALAAQNIVNDGVIRATSNNFNGTNNAGGGITGNGYLLIDGTVNNYTMDIHQKILINEGKTLNINANRIFAPVETNGKLIVSGDGMSLDYDVTGDGVTSFEGGTRYLTSNIYTNLVNVPGTLVVASDLLNTTKSVTNNGTLHLTSGTTNKAIGGTGNLFILADQNVILNALVSNTIYLDAGSTLTISADNLGKSVARLNPNSTLNLLSGTLKQNISNGNGSIVNIAGDVTVEDVVLQPKVHVNEDGTLTANSKNLFGSIDNDGSLYLSGDLGNRKVTGSGITYIDKELTFDNNNSGISEGGLNLNNGTLVVSNDSFATSSVGTLSGTGNLIFDVSWDNVDKLSLNSNSDGVVKIDASKLNYINLPNFDTPTNSAILQVLVGGSNARLELVNDTIQQSLRQEAYDTAVPDVFFDDPFYKYITEGLLTGTIKLANTTSTNDSIQFINVSTIWNEQQKQPGALLHSWNILKTDEERHFRFKTASDTYNALQDIGDTTPGKLTIHGVASEDGSLKSVIEMNNQSGFVLNGNSNLNIENVKFTNLKDYFIDLKNSAASLGSFDEDGNPIGGLINVTIDTMNVEETSSNNLAGTVIKSPNSNTIAQIKDSTFKNINVVKNSTDKVSNRYIYGGLFDISGNTEKLSAGIINSEFSNNTITFNTPDSAGNFIQGGLVQLGGKAKLDTISGKFNYNTMTAKNALYGGVFNFDSSVNKIVDSEFIGNTIIGLGNHNDIEGAAIRLSDGNSIKIIDNVLFKNNTAINDNGNRISYGGAIMSYGTGLGDINNSRFINNTAGQGGAIWSNHSIGSITNSLFQGNSAFTEAGALFIKENRGSINEISHTQFIENYALGSCAGAVEITGGGGLNKTVNLMDDLLFDGNYLSVEVSGPYDVSGGALFNSCTIKKLTNSTFTNNYIDSKGARGNYSGAISNNGVIELIDNVIFKDNYINGHTSSMFGTAISINGGNSSINLIKNSRFENNILHGEEGGTGLGGAIHVSNSSNRGLGEISNSTFIGNGIIKNNGTWYSNTRGGAICFETGDTTITNSIFRDNFVNWSTNEARERTTGGAIWADINLNIVATGEDGLTEFTGNYIQTKLVKESEAIFMNKAGSTLTLNANNNGRILFNDFINGIADGYLVNITGDNTGRLSLYNDIKNAAITAENINIDTADGKLFNYNFKSLDSKTSAKYTIDIDYANQTADTFTLGEGSTGTILIDKINAIATSDKDYKIQILHAQDNSIQLALSDNIVSVYDIVGNLGNTVYSTDKFHQYEGLATATTNTTNDSIAYLHDADMDGLRLIATSENNDDRSFIFNSADNYIITDSDKIVVAPGTLHIKGIIADDGSLSILDATGINDIAFDIANGSNMSVKDTKIIGNEHSLFQTAEGSKLTIDNVYIDGNINNSEVDIIGSGATIDGLASSSNMTLQSGVLKFNTDTFEDNGHLNAQNGKIDFADNNVDSPYYLSQLVSNRNVNYAIDLDLSNELSDSLVLTSTGNSGVVTISELNFINFDNIERKHNFITSVLNDTNKENNIQLAIADSIAKTKLKDISRIEEDQILEVTDFSHKYYNRKRNGELFVELGLATTNTSNDSLSVNITEDWEDTVEIVSYKGGTLKLVNQSEQAQRIFQSSDASEIYNVMEDLGKTAAGNMIIQGTSTEDQRSTVDLRNHSGFEVGKDTILTVNDARISGNEDIINVTDSSAIINLSNAYINGNIKGSTNFNINVQGLQDTTINGIIENGNLTLSKGGIFINEDTFASANSTLNVEAGNIYLNNKKLDEYNIHNLVSSDKGKYSIDVDLDNMTADHINVSNGSGIIVIEEMSIIGSLKDVGIDDDYTIQILNSPNSDIQLQLSETALSQLDKDVKLGVQEEILRTDEVMPVTKWDKDYYQTIQEYDIWGRLNLTDKVTKNDSLHLYHLYTDIGRKYERLGDTLKLLSQLETESDRNFVFDSASNVYNLRDDIGDVTQGNYNITGVAGLDGNSNQIVSTINMNKYAGFNLNNDTVMTVQNVNFTNSALRDGSLFNIENPNTVLNLNNVQITDTLSTNAIINSGTINMTGGNILLDSGISGLGITNIEGADVHLGDGVAFAQSQVNVNSGSLTLGENNVIRGSLKVATDGSVTLVANAITSSVVNDGSLIFTDGNITKDISGDGVTYIDGTLVNKAQINNDVSVNTGSLKTSADSIGGEINNDALLILTGDLDKNVSGSGTTNVDETLRLSAGAGFDGVLNLNDGNITTKDSLLNNYNIGTLLNSGTFSIDADFANNTSDKFIVGNNSKGTIYLNEINFINLDSISNTTKIQILDTNGSDNTQLALNPKISDVAYKTGRTSRNEQDVINNITNYKDLYYNYIREGDLFGNLVLGTTSTTNDSIQIAIDESKTTWDSDRTKTTSMGDSLVLWNQLESEDNKEFIIDEIDTYVVTQGVDLGETKGTNVSLNGVATTSENQSTIDLNSNTGFELSNATTFNINNIKLTGTDTLITSSNTSATINVKDSYIDGDIVGAGNSLTISGTDITTLNSTLSNIQTTLNSGSLKFNIDTFANTDDTLNANGGSILMQNDKAEHYVINQLTSNENAKYSIDIDLATQTADTIKTNTASRGSVVLDSLNILGTISSEDLAENYKIKILDTQNSDLQLALSDNLQNELSKTEYLVKTQKSSADSTVNAVNNWKDKYYQVDTVINYYGTLGLATSSTTNDSLGINITRNDSDTAQGKSMGDTLTLLNKLETEVAREFNFDDAQNVYNLSSDLGITSEGSLTINGVSNGESEKSTVNLNSHSGFELSNDTTLNINNTKLTGSETLISADNSNATINVKDSYIDGDIVGAGNSLTISGTDITTLNSTLSNIQTTLNSGSLKFNIDTFANTDDTLNANGGSILMQNDKAEHYVINQLTSNENAKYSIDIDLATQTADTIKTNNASNGSVVLDSLNILGAINSEDLNENYKIKILDTQNSDLQLALSDNLQNKLSKTEYLVKTQKSSADSTVNAVNNWKDKYYQVDTVINYYGTLGLATSSTTNDSLGINITRNDSDTAQGKSMGDTLTLLNKLETEVAREFNFDDAQNVYNLSSDLGITSEGSLTINGVSNGESEKSTVNLNSHSGFELSNDTTLNINNTKLTGAETLISADNSNATINVKDSYIDGDIVGAGNSLTISGSDVTTLNSTLSNIQTTLNSGSLKFNIDTFANSDDILNANSGSILLSNNQIENYVINQLTSDENVKYSIDIDLSNKTADTITNNLASSGVITIDNINFTGNNTPSKEFTVQILNTIDDSIQLALSEKYTNQKYNLGEAHEQWNDLKASIYADEYFNKYERYGIRYGSLKLATTSTENDSITLNYDKTEWGNTTSSRYLDTLKELNQYVVNPDKGETERDFNFKDSSLYLVKEDLGVSSDGIFNINGVTNDSAKSTIDLDNHYGFELNNSTTLNLKDIKLTGNSNLITASNSNALINITNSYIDGNITANNNNITITGDSLTTLNGTITNAHTKLDNGSLKFNTNTFSDSQDSLTASNGSILLSNNKIENYIINSLTSDENVKYSIDINFDNKTSDMLTINNGTGIVTLDNLNITGSITNPNEEYKIQILDVKSGDIQLALSENTASQLGKDEYILGTSTTYTLDKVKNVTNWKDSYNKYKKDITTFGNLDLAKTNTENDSIGIKITKVEEGELKFDGSQGDTLRVVNNSTDVQNKIFEFDTSKDEYDVKENLGETTGSLVIKGVKVSENSSTIDFNEHSGFEINKNSGLNIIDTELKNARAKSGSVMNVQSTNAVVNLTNVSLLNNTAVGDKGGAIYSNSDINFKSDNSDIVIRGNRTHKDNEAIYLGKDAKLTLNTVNNAKLQIYDKINGDSGYQTLITGDSSGDVYLNSKIDNSRVIMEEITLHLADNNHLESSSVKINSGTLDLVNNKAQHQFAKTFNIAGDFKLNADVDLKNVSMDRLPANTSISKDAFINVDKLNLISDTNAYSVAIPFAYRQFKDNVKYIGPKTLSKETQVTTAYAPIFKYDIRYENRKDLGYFVFKKGGGFSPSESGAYNPAILATPVASQAGGFVAMNETFNYAFEHSKTFSMLPRAQRLAMFNSNKYSITDSNSLHPMDKSVNSACWVKPYANFESIGLANGPKVNITSYGTLAGGDSEFKTLRNGWGTVTTAYIGYNGSNQNYTGVSTSQNGGLIGLTQTFYKNNFFTAITASAGASVGESKTMYGQDNFSMLLAGVASKSGYNLEFKEGKYIIQPQMLLSYTYVNTFDYTNAAGVRLNSDPLHTIQIHPGIKFAANLKNGWQPYAGAGVVWNILNDTRVTADNAHLPEMSIKPYAEYGFGIQKRWKDTFTADLSAMLRNGGRNGITLTASFRWILGKENKSIQTVNNKNNNYLNENRKVVKKLDLNKNNTTKTSNKAILKQL